MNVLEKALCVASVLYAFVGGLVLPLLLAPGDRIDLVAVFGQSRLLVALFAVAATLAAVRLGYGVVHKAKDSSPILRLLLKLLVVQGPAGAAGVLGAAGVVALGLVQAAYPSLLFVIVFTSGLSFGTAGLAAMWSAPEYKQILTRRRTGQANPSESGNAP